MSAHRRPTRLRMVGDAIAAVCSHLLQPATVRDARRRDAVRLADLYIAREGNKP